MFQLKVRQRELAALKAEHERKLACCDTCTAFKRAPSLVTRADAAELASDRASCGGTVLSGLQVPSAVLAVAARTGPKAARHGRASLRILHRVYAASHTCAVLFRSLRHPVHSRNLSVRRLNCSRCRRSQQKTTTERALSQTATSYKKGVIGCLRQRLARESR